MVQQSKTKQPELLLQVGDDDQQTKLVLETEQEAIADLPQDASPLQKPKKSKRSLLRWIIYGGLGFGILAIVLPAFLGQTVGCGGNKARNAEGKTYVGTMNRAQQAFWLEKSAFAKSIPALDIGIQEETSSFKYEIQRLPLVSYQYAIPKNDKVKGFVGAVFVVVPEDTQTEKKEITTVTILCESQGTGLQEKLSKPSLQNGKPICPEGTLSLN
ncbi:type IV pilin-like G/H family protein [Pseudanabaena sp. ABRG5-3]|uniref:type IV pilin-like G/H family protein n=1 Tax=Pseudanabaena sp. ABRG5-3 TaxID=685565 RepID=UPI000DC72594|nr:type IV pilin-like G/H family protein [Pseudanabaena sp. ABRG5-3]BBC26170.1 general secretion pathway protein H [Pseudanabaena sp. ABRG5-3]